MFFYIPIKNNFAFLSEKNLRNVLKYVISDDQFSGLWKFLENWRKTHNYVEQKAVQSTGHCVCHPTSILPQNPEFESSL